MCLNQILSTRYIKLISAIYFGNPGKDEIEREGFKKKIFV